MTQDDTAQDAGTPPEADVPVINAATLFREGREAKVIYGEQTYWLRLTRAGKLILTK